MSLDAPYHFVFDVESAGLHGDGFAYGYVVLRASDLIFEETGQEFVDPYRSARGYIGGFDWVKANWRPPEHVAAYRSISEFRARFWKTWIEWRGQGAIMWADVPWPVESRFLNACIEDDPQRVGPYPLYDITTLAEGLGVSVPRSNEEREHDALGDARHSARLLAACLTKLRGGPWSSRSVR